MIRLLSYIYPITKKVESQYNGTLEITWHNGKKYLNTKNANYSYGSLQTILKFGLQKINPSNCKKVLILGLGAGSVIDTLINDLNYNNHITAVDLDPVIIDIVQQEFNLSQTKNLKITCEDAIRFMSNNKDEFDLIIVDLFLDTKVPDSFFEISFWKDILRGLSKQGKILFNALLDHDASGLCDVKAFLAANQFRTEQFDKVNGTNTLLIAKLVN